MQTFIPFFLITKNRDGSTEITIPKQKRAFEWLYFTV